MVVGEPSELMIFAKWQCIGDNVSIVSIDAVRVESSRTFRSSLFEDVCYN